MMFVVAHVAAYLPWMTRYELEGVIRIERYCDSCVKKVFAGEQVI
jgi:hypothetical protein